MNTSQEIKNYFGIDYEKEADIVSKTVEKNVHTILLCGTPAIDFAKTCKTVIDKHYTKSPDDILSDIVFKKQNLGYDNWTVEPVFKYEPRYT